VLAQCAGKQHQRAKLQQRDQQRERKQAEQPPLPDRRLLHFHDRPRTRRAASCGGRFLLPLSSAGGGAAGGTRLIHRDGGGPRSRQYDRSVAAAENKSAQMAARRVCVDAVRERCTFAPDCEGLPLARVLERRAAREADLAGKAEPNIGG
jgi:hypothetical protein